MLKHRSIIDAHMGCISRAVLIACMLAASPQVASSEPAGGPKAASVLFAQIADDGLSGTVNGGNLTIIKSACQQAHSDPDGKDWADDVDGGVAKIFRFLDRETAKMLNLAACRHQLRRSRKAFASVWFCFTCAGRVLSEVQLSRIEA